MDQNNRQCDNTFTIHTCMPKRFSVITPAYNRANYIVATIKSVQAQTVPDWEHIVVDDGSTDTTAQVVKQAAVSDSRIRYIHQENSRAPAARNHGLRVARGEVIVYLDSDDVACPQLLEKIGLTLRANPTGIFGMPNHQRQKVLLDATGAVIKSLPVELAQTSPVQLQDIYHWKTHTTSSGLFHLRRAFEDGVRWDTHIRRFQDWDMLMQLGNAYPGGFVYIPDSLVEYTERFGGNGMCSTASYADWAAGFEAMYQKHKNDPLLVGQAWYPQRIEKYTKLQQQFERGEVPAPGVRHFS